MDFVAGPETQIRFATQGSAHIARHPTQKSTVPPQGQSRAYASPRSTHRFPARRMRPVVSTPICPVRSPRRRDHPRWRSLCPTTVRQSDRGVRFPLSRPGISGPDGRSAANWPSRQPPMVRIHPRPMHRGPRSSAPCWRIPSHLLRRQEGTARSKASTG